MKTFTSKELQEILKLHKMWLNGEDGGVRANLSGADLTGADLTNATLPDLKIKLESDDFVAYKKVLAKTGEEVILTLLVPKDALKTSSLIGRKCRASQFKVVSAQYCGSDQTCEEIEFYSKHDRNFVYKIGEMAEVVDFDPDIRIECTKGLHFFVTKQEAINY